MNYLVASVLTIFAFPCLATALTEQFSQMDLNHDGVLSEEEFVNGMKSAQEKQSSEKSQNLTGVIPDPEKEEVISTVVSQAKKNLPYKIDNTTTWTDIYAQGSEVHYVYNIDMDTSVLSSNQLENLKPMLKNQICPVIIPSMCKSVREVVLKKGIALMMHYQDKTGTELTSCYITDADCE